MYFIIDKILRLLTYLISLLYGVCECGRYLDRTYCVRVEVIYELGEVHLDSVTPWILLNYRAICGPLFKQIRYKLILLFLNTK